MSYLHERTSIEQYSRAILRRTINCFPFIHNYYLLNSCLAYLQMAKGNVVALYSVPFQYQT